MPGVALLANTEEQTMKPKLLAANHAYSMFGTTLYVGVLWALRFFWYPGWRKLKVSNYFDQFVPQTTAATKFFTVVVPLMYLSLATMTVTERKSRLRWVPLGGLTCLSAATYVGQGHIIPINKILAQGVTDQTELEEYLRRWMALNDIRWGLMTTMWLILMYYFIAKGNLLEVIEGDTP
jgi:hypothetical protein